MSTRDDLTTAASAGFKAKYGYAYFHCAELIFGSKIRAKPGVSPPFPDTSITWSARNPGGLRVESSIDDGATWQVVPQSGSPIPGPENLPWAIGSVLTNKRVLLRQIFIDGAPGTVLDSITVTLTTDLGEVVTRTESGAALAQGTLLGCEYSNATGINGVRVIPQVYLQYQGNRGALHRQLVPHDAGGQPQDLHLSHGDIFLEGREFQNVDNPDHLDKAAMAAEVWIYPTQVTGTIMAWTTLQSGFGGPTAGHPSEFLGVTLYLLGLGGTSTQLIFDTPINDTTVKSAMNFIQLNQWTHVAFSYDGLWLSLYFNGVLIGRRSYSTATGPITDFDVNDLDRVLVGQALPTDNRFVVGRNPVGTSSPATSFKGYMSELRIYQRALTPGQIIQRMRRRLLAAEFTTLVTEDRLRAYYPLWDSGAQYAFDQTGNNLHLAFNQIQTPGQPPLPPQLGYASVNNLSWIGFPTTVTPSGPDSRPYSPGRISPSFSVDVPGDIMRITNAPHNITLPDGRVFSGVGQFGTIDAVQEPADLVPSEMKLTLSGLPGNTVSLALRATYLDRPCVVYLILLDPSGHVVNDKTIVFEGRMDRLDVSMQAEPDTGTIIVTCQMTAESHLRRWSDPGHQRWNYQAQYFTYGDDYGFEFLAAMVDREVWWPSQIPATTPPGSH